MFCANNVEKLNISDILIVYQIIKVPTGGKTLYKVFLVEDEIVVREGIRANIHWEATDFVFCGEAPDGEIALPLIQELKPDILITDIKMPFMDGLQLCKIVKKSMPWIKVLILSGHDEFNYAREAISIGVTEYLLKPISSVELLKALNKVALQIEGEKKEREDIEALRHQLQDNMQLYRGKFLGDLCLGAASSLEAVEKSERFNINIISKYYVVLIMEAELKEKISPNSMYSEYLKAEKLLNGIVEKNSEVICFKKGMDETVLIIKGDHPDELEESAYNIAQSIKYEVERNTQYLLTIGIGSVRERIQGISQSFADAESARNYKYIFGKNKIIGINDIERAGTERKELLKIEKNSITDYLKYGERSVLNTFLENYVQELSQSALKSTIYTNYVFVDIILTTARFVNELGGNLEELCPEISELEKVVVKIDTVGRFKEYTGKILNSALEYRDSRVENKYSSIINKAKDFINNNFADPNISLNSVAAYVSVSPSHFSAVFSQETGGTFIEYLTQTRIKKAMEFLRSTSLKSSEIAYKAGYNDPHYFSYLFKKVTGQTPKEYRSEGQKS